MQNEAYRLTGFTAVASALGFLLRWLQNMRILDPETGLAEAGRPISFVVAGLIVLVAAAIAVFAFGGKDRLSPTAPEAALGGKTFLYTAFCALPGIVLAAAGAVLLASSWPQSEAFTWKLCGGGALAAALGTILLAGGISKPERAAHRRVGACLLILFGALWLVAEYKAAAADPVIWRFVVDILAICAVLMAYYYVAGYFFEEPSPRMAVFFCYMGAFLCVMSAVDEHSLAESLCFAAAAIQLFVWGYALVCNMRRGPEPLPEAPAPETAE